MGKKSEPQSPVESSSGALTHNPFSALAGRVSGTAPAATPAPRPPPAPPVANDMELRFPAKVVIRRETKGRGGKTVTRLSGIPVFHLTEVATRLRKALGCGATVENEDVVLQGALEERAWAWLLAQGARRLVNGNSPPPSASREPVSLPGTGPESNATLRTSIRPGLRVAVVLKAHQHTGELTTGIVSELLTNSQRHPRGIKVRLESGEVGRVQRIL